LTVERAPFATLNVDRMVAAPPARRPVGAP
jgi:hypothetical protein